MAKAIVAIVLGGILGIPALINAIRTKTLANSNPDAAFETSHAANKWGNIGIIVGTILNALYITFIIANS